MRHPGSYIALFFLTLSAIFIAVSVKNYLHTKGEDSPARQTWFRIAIIFAIVGTILLIIHGR